MHGIRRRGTMPAETQEPEGDDSVIGLDQRCPDLRNEPDVADRCGRDSEAELHGQCRYD